MTLAMRNASKETGAFSAEMISKCSENWLGRMSTSMTWVVGATQILPVVAGTGSTPPWPKKNGFSTRTPSCPASIGIRTQPALVICRQSAPSSSANAPRELFITPPG